MGRYDVAPPTVTVSYQECRARCRVVGWEDDVVRCELDRIGPDEARALTAGNTVEVAWSTETSLRSIDGTVGRPTAGVYPITFQGEIRTVQRRDRVRARCIFRCELAVPEGVGARTFTVETIDLSATGVGLRAPMIAEPGTSIVVAIFPNNDPPLPLIAGRVASAVPDTDRVGVAFTSAVPGTFDKVSNVVARLLSNRAAH